MRLEQEFLYGDNKVSVFDEEYDKRKNILRQLYKEKGDEEAIKNLEEFINRVEVKEESDNNKEKDSLTDKERNNKK